MKGLLDVLDALGRGWVATLIGIIGILLAVVFYARSKIRPKLVWQHVGWRLIGGSHPVLGTNIEIRFRGEVVPRVSLTEVATWNAGNATLRGDDVVGTDRLRLTVPAGDRILECRTLAVTRSVNGFAIRSEGSDAVLEFDFLDPRDGARVSVLHTAADARASLVGTVRGMPAGPKYLGQIESQHPPVWAGLLVTVGALSMVTAGLIVPRLRQPGWFVLSGIVLVVGIGVLAARRKFPPALETRQKSPSKRE